MRRQRVKLSRLVVQKPVRLGKNVPLMIMSLTGHPLHAPHRSAASRCSSKGSGTIRLSSGTSLCISQTQTAQGRHQPGLVCTSESLLSDEVGWEEKGHDVKWSLSANVLWLWQSSFSPPLESSQNKQLQAYNHFPCHLRHHTTQPSRSPQNH